MDERSTTHCTWDARIGRWSGSERTDRPGDRDDGSGGIGRATGERIYARGALDVEPEETDQAVDETV